MAFIALLFINNWAFSQNSNCSRETLFGKTKICLPKIDGYQECYLDSSVKTFADATEIPANMVLGYYLTNDTFKKKDSIGLFIPNDVFKIYGTKELMNIQANNNFLNQMKGFMKSNFISKNWNSIKNDIDKIGYEIEVKSPTIIKSYSKTKNSFTLVMLVKYEPKDSKPYTLAMTINILLINKRIIWFAYYLQFKNKESVQKAQEKSDLILEKILKSNQ